MAEIPTITVNGVEIRYMNCKGMTFKRFEKLFEDIFKNSFDMKNAHKRVMEAINNHGQDNRSSKQSG